MLPSMKLMNQHAWQVDTQFGRVRVVVMGWLCSRYCVPCTDENTDDDIAELISDRRLILARLKKMVTMTNHGHRNVVNGNFKWSYDKKHFTFHIPFFMLFMCKNIRKVTRNYWIILQFVDFINPSSSVRRIKELRNRIIIQQYLRIPEIE